MRLNVHADPGGGACCYNGAVFTMKFITMFFFFLQAEDGIRDLARSRGLGDVYKRQDYSGISLP